MIRSEKSIQNRVPIHKQIVHDWLYRNGLKNRGFGKEASQNSYLEPASIVQAQGASEDKNFEKEPTLSKTDSSGYFGIKRGFDILVSSCVLLCGLPLFTLIAAIIKCSSPGPIFYCSMRLGRDGKLFKFWKFRSMYKDASQKLDQLLRSNHELRKEWNVYFKLKNDPRITCFGKFLRKTSLDEFPQFWNVLKGDLSIVGPRPYLPNELETIKKIAGVQVQKMLAVRPGLTGIWQTSGRNCLTFEQRVKLDLKYIGSRSFLFDLRLIAKTIPLLLFPKGAF
ncbi:MAG TPA: sugar transferase [Rhabdochlamydiaceae bacterium]|jgi:undecaprenyl-phosphate galactose phosphotransferase